MKGTHAELTHKTTSLEPIWDFDAAHVLVASETTPASSAMAGALRSAGYIVTSCRHSEVRRHLRTHRATAVELLVLDGSASPRTASAILEALRVAHSTLPIILVADRDLELRTEADRLGVEAVLDAPLQVDELRRAAARIVPIIRELRGGDPFVRLAV